MITITQLIAVLFKVITIITMNPNIPQDVKNEVMVEITSAISQTRGEVVSEEKQSIITNVSTTTIPTVLGNATTTPKLKAKIGEITKNEDGDNIIPVIFNDASAVGIYSYCNDRKPFEDNYFVVYKKDYPSGYSLRYKNIGKCKFEFSSKDNIFGEDSVDTVNVELK